MQSIAVDLSRETQERIGQIFGILSTDTDSRVGDALIATIEDALVRGINEGLLKDDAPADKIFEGAVARVNNALTKVIEDRNLPVNPTTTKSVLVLQKGADVVIATWGEPHVLLFHVSDRRPSGRVYDLLSDSRADQNSEARRSGSRCYSNIISGIVGDRDRLLLATHDISQWLSQEALKHIVLSGTPDAASVALQEQLMQAAPKLAVALLLVDAEHPEYVPPAGPYTHPSAPQHSMDNLMHTADRARDIMSPPVVGSLLRRLSKSASDGIRHAKDALMAETAPTTDAVTDETDEVMEELREAAAADEIEINDVSSSILEEFIVPVRPTPSAKTSSAPSAPANPSHVPTSVAPAPAGRRFSVPLNAKKAADVLARWSDGAATDIIHNFNGLPKKRRLLLLSSLALVLVLNHSVAIADWNRSTAVTAAANGKLIASIEQKIDSAESSIIYRDEARAHTLLDDATQLIATLPDHPDSAAAEKDRLKGLVATKYNALRHAAALPAAQVIASVSGTNGPVDLKHLVLRQQIAWTAGSDGSVFRTDLKDGSTKASGKAAAHPTIFALASNGLIVGTSAGLTRFNYSSDGSTPVAIDLHGNDVTITDVDSFGTRLYVLDAAHNRILRHDAGPTGYGAPSFYLKDGTDLANGVSLTIDGAVYVAMKDGSVARFLSGKREDFAVQKVDPVVTAPVKIRTLDTSPNVYLLEGSSPARIIAFSKKTGGLVAQYVSDQLNGATDFSVDEASKVIYAVHGNSILKFMIPEAQQ